MKKDLHARHAHLAVCFFLHDDAYYLAESIASYAPAGKVFAFVSRVAWHDSPGDWEAAAEVARATGAEVVVGEWRSEEEHRRAAQAHLLELGFTHALIPDGDEIVELRLLDSLVKIAKEELAERVHVCWDTYWKSPEYVIRPRERFTPLILIDLRKVYSTSKREFEGGRPILLGPEHGLIHHLSYAGPDARILRKISTWGHRDEVQPGWYENVWLGWDSNKLLGNLHPTHPNAYGFAERIHVPEVLRPALIRYGELCGSNGRLPTEDPASLALSTSENPPILKKSESPGVRARTELPGAVEVNGIVGFLTDGDITLLSDRASRIPPGGTILEIGSFLGLSCVTMGSALIAKGNLDARIICVDKWEGSKEFRALSKVCDRNMFDLFAANIKDAGVDALITPMQMSSHEAAPLIEPCSLDLLFIDGDHTYKGCYADLVRYYSTVRPNGVILGHDCVPGGPVEKAVIRFCRENGLRYAVHEMLGTHYMFEFQVPLTTSAQVDQSSPALRTPEPQPCVVESPTSNVSVVIPLYGGTDDIRKCLDSLVCCGDLIREVVVVDNASPDGAANVVEEFASKASHIAIFTFIRNDTNRGFAAACNQGFAKTSGEIVVFLNSDTIVPKAGLARLIEAVTQSGAVAAAGPVTNCSGHGQQIAHTYTSLDTLDLFAEDIASNTAEDIETDMLVGFCVAVKRSVLEEVGGLDERFGLGTFEDNDLCYRMRRAGYRLIVAARSFVHHHGSQTLNRMNLDTQALLRRNEAIYRNKWRLDLELGYASTLSGLSFERVAFDPANHPEVRERKMREKARRAGISLCMIVRDEERVLGEALASAKPFFEEMIVVDTGSKDRTVEIARTMGAKVFEFPWTDSFSDARNESLRHATGRWIFWMDADDTLPWASGEALIEAALGAGKHIAAFIVPVKFVDEGAAGTQVDHVKLFRNTPGLAFEGRIHEQILPSLRRHGQVARCNAVVLHSGYDTSSEGQAKKRKRDIKLLLLDLKERPNHPFVLFNLGMTQHYGGKHRSAVRWFRRCIAASRTEESHLRKVYALMALSLRALELDDEAVDIIRQGVEIIPDDPELHFHAGNLLSEQDPEQAKQHYRNTLDADISGHFSSIDTGILGFKTLHNLASLCARTGQYLEARELLMKAIEAAPEFLPSVFLLFDAALESSDYATAKRMLERVGASQGKSDSWAGMGIRLAEAVGGRENAEAFLRNTISSDQRAAAPRMELARRLLDDGREAEAAEHLDLLARAGSAEAAFYMGVYYTRRGALRQALIWMERALEITPNHDDTKKQVMNLRSALGGGAPPVTFEQAIAQIANDLEIDPQELQAYSEEDHIGGYGAKESNGVGKSWPGGSVWEVEGRILYTLARALKPRTIIEVGSYLGCSTSHLALACARNGSGKVYAVDPASEFSRVDPELLPYIEAVKEDARSWTPPEKADFLFEDGTHEPGFTKCILESLLPSINTHGLIVTHDYAHVDHGPHVGKEFDEALGHPARPLLIEPSNCGLGYAFKA